jgi:peptide methionine sulfoxide reductase msrA/msrB
MEKYMASIRGVLSTQAGYANGKTENPSYEEVCYRNTGHAETVRVVYDPETVPLDFLLELYYEAIDPVSINRQGGDVGTQYRTGIYYVDPGDRPVVERSLARLQKKLGKPVAIESEPLHNFCPRRSITRSTWTRTRVATVISAGSSLKRRRGPR